LIFYKQAPILYGGAALKRLLIILVILVMAFSCVPVTTVPPEVTNEVPVAYIDSISLTRIFQGEQISFGGHGTDPDGTIVAYEWRSSLDGVLSTTADFETSSLSAGKNVIYFKVQDNKGTWSKEIYRDVTVIPPGSVKPIINLFEVNPKIITKGDIAVLSWEIRGANTVNIVPDIGDVSSKDTREISPDAETFYTLTATNEAGSMVLEIRIKVSPEKITTVEVFSIIGEEGYVSRGGKIEQPPEVGDTKSGDSLQAFMSFDISMIPVGSTIEDASIDISQYLEYGSPFGALGGLGIFHDQYDVLDKQDYVATFSGTAMVVTYSAPYFSYTSNMMKQAIQKQVDNGASRFQIRLQFEKPMFYHSQADYLAFWPGKNKLSITYR
jgi:hypothetical protein